MAPAPQPPPPAADDRPERALAVVTPLFRDGGEPAVWAPATVAPPRPSSRHRVVAAAVLGLLGVTVAVFHSRAVGERLSERLDAGCLDVDDCRALVQFAEAARDTCWFGCSARGELVSQARARFRSALELAAHQERQRQDDDYERVLETRRKTEAERVDHEHAQRLEALDRQHRHELALVAAETERVREQKMEREQKRVAYFQKLSREQRRARLAACHEQGVVCDDLVLELAAAAGSETESSELIETHERHVTGQRRASRRASPARVAPPTAAPAPNSPGLKPAPL